MMVVRESPCQKLPELFVRTASLALVATALAVTLALPAQALLDESFESGFGAWQVLGDVMLEDTSITQQFGTAATQGDFHLVMSTLPNNVVDQGAPLGQAGAFSGTDAIAGAALEAALGIPAGDIDLMSVSGFPAIQGSGFYQEFTAVDNSTLSFEWNFMTNESTPTATYTDFLFWGITASGGGPLLQGGILMDTAQAAEFGPAPGVSPFGEETGYRTENATIAVGGAYRIVFGVVDVRDDNFTSGALLDNFQLVPEPSTALLILSGMFILAFVGRSPTREAVPAEQRA